MVLSSTSFDDGEEIPQKHGKKIENVSPHLAWQDAPEDTKSFALSLVDTHPVARNYLHWLVVDIDAATTSLQEGASRRAMPRRSRELKPYAGPFPPSGTHDYEFTLYALTADRIELPDKASLDTFIKTVKPRALATAKLVGKFTKTR